MVLPCDMVLLSGSCIVDESLLTGESAPVMKEPVDFDSPELDCSSDFEQKRHILHGGSRLIQISSSSIGLRNVSVKSSLANNACVGFVARTGFATCQGQLLKTMLYNFDRPSSNNLETFIFLGFLFVFALIASGYVWIRMSPLIEESSRFKLFVECISILTDVIPPELSVELTNAVNASVAALRGVGVFCTEPYRIPFAGKLDVCCFDKTGTLTADEMVLEGVVVDTSPFIEQMNTPIEQFEQCRKPEAIEVLACCHSLAMLANGDWVGDPLEKTCLHAIGWRLSTRENVVFGPSKSNEAVKHIEVRHHFSSKLKRMCCVASSGGSTLKDSSVYFCAVKGAPEVVREMLARIPDGYDQAVNALTLRGRRLLALGYKRLPDVKNSRDARNLKREDLEKDLEFAGLVVVACPLKSECSEILAELRQSSHHIKMVTGDNAMTACHVARQLSIDTFSRTLLCDSLTNESVIFRCVQSGHLEKVNFSSFQKDLRVLYDSSNLCLTGNMFDLIDSTLSQAQAELLMAACSVFARFAPQQKGKLINHLKNRGFHTLMCGDGTNDVGALKNAHVGVAIIPDSAYTPATSTDSDVVKLGDASIAAPFTSKKSSIEAVCQIVKQGRCTLVTTLQIFKIIALNALILAYGRSVLYVQGVKFSDAQATLQGLFIAVCFLGLSRSRPLEKLSKQRPIPDILNLYTIVSILLQSTVHLATLVRLNSFAQRLTVQRTDMLIDLEAKFFPNMVNSVIYATMALLQVINFAVNHNGHPFMQSLQENKLLRTSLFGLSFFIILAVSGTIPDISNYFQIDLFPPHLLRTFMSTIALDTSLCFTIDRFCDFSLSRSARRIKRLI